MTSAIRQALFLYVLVCILIGYVAAPLSIEPNPPVAIAMWLIPAVAWFAIRNRPHGFWFESWGLVPVLMILQAVLNVCCSHLGDAIALFGQLSAITVIVRSNPFPHARVLRARRGIETFTMMQATQ